MTMEENNYCLFHNELMQDIRNSLRDASMLAAKKDYEQVILLLEKTANDSKCQNYIGGMFCAYKHLGDVYKKMVFVLSCYYIGTF